MIKLFTIFAFLQLADFLTTAAALRLGGSEQNPLVLHLMAAGRLEGLALAKLVSLGIGVGFLVAKKYRALHWSNMAFGVIVLWNLSIVVRLIS